MEPKSTKVKRGGRKTIPFIKPIRTGDKWYNYVIYGFKIVFYIIACGFGALGQLFITMLQMSIFGLLIGLVIGSVIFFKVYPDFKVCREKAYDVMSNMDRTDFSLLSDTEVYDKDGNQIGLINAGHYEYANINDISMNIQNTYIAQEDRRFKEHGGVDLISIARAGLSLIKNQGEITQGGSTITQQVIKNTYLTNERTFERKVIEILLAPILEKKFSKSDIMEFYCNTNFYGNRCYGVQAASRYYFGKDAKYVSLDEAALLVGISNSPTAYDPVRNPEKALEKRNRVLRTLVDTGEINEAYYVKLSSQPLNIVQEYGEGTKENYQSSYAIHCASLELMKNSKFEFKYTFKNKEEYEDYKEKYGEAYNNASETIRSGGYKIYTSLDSNIQNQLQSVIDNGLKKFVEQQENGKYALQGASVVVDNKTNYVVAIVGGRGTDDEYNRGYLSARQPGSTIKPLIDYAPAFDTGEYYPSKVMNDHKWEGGPSNSGSYFGNVTLREALNRSLNTIAWQVLDGIGVETGLNYLDRMQFMNISYIDNGVPSLSIGGFTHGVRVVDMAKGYSTLANNGAYSDNTCITSIKHEHDGEVYKRKIRTEQVYMPDTAYMITDILKGTFGETGTARGLDLGAIPAAGKTGTTNSNKDTWFCGYTKHYTTAVWVGYDQPRAMPGVFGATYSGKMWKEIMLQLNQSLPVEDWDRPETVIEAHYDEEGNKVLVETGRQDLFSMTAELEAEVRERERKQAELKKKVLNDLGLFESFQITDVEDTYKVNIKYNEIKNKISVLELEADRNECNNRAYKKYAELTQTVKEWESTIVAYENEQEQLKLEAKRLADLEATNKRVELTKKALIDDFESSYKVLNELKYQQTNWMDLANKAISKLNKCTSYSEYTLLEEKLHKAIDNVPKLPSVEQWKVMETERLKVEAESRAAEELLRQQELKALQESLEAQERESKAALQPSEYGPGTINGTGPGKDISSPNSYPNGYNNSNRPVKDNGPGVNNY